MTPESRFRLNESDVIFERFDEELIAIQLATGAYHNILGAGVDVFPLLPHELTVAEMAEALAEKYDASPAVIAEDLKHFLEHLRTESLVIAHSENHGNGQRPGLSHSGPRLPYTPPDLHSFRDLQDLFLIDPVHDVGPTGWPQTKISLTPDQEVRYRPGSASNVILERFDEETVAIHLGSGAYHSLSGAAEDIFLLLAEEPSQAEIVQALRTKYEAPEQGIADAAAQFLGSLVYAGLAEQTAAAPETLLPVRELALAKPGRNLPFAAPKLDPRRDRLAPATFLPGAQDWSPLAFARKRFLILVDGLSFRIAGPETVVIDFRKGEYYLLNSSATTAYRLLQQQPTASELVNALATVYDLNRHELIAAVLILLRNLAQEGLVTVADASETSRRIELDEFRAHEPYEPFSIEAFRELRGLFLPFPGTRSQRARPGGNAPELVSLLAAYQQEVAARTGQTEAIYHIAGRKVRVHCAGSLQVPELGLAFGHLTNGFGQSIPDDLTIQAWDGVSGGPPQNPFLASYLHEFYSHWDTACGPRGEVLAFHSEQLPVLYHAGPDILMVIDRETRTAYYLKRDQSPLPYWEIGSPFRTILHYWLSLDGLQFVHGGAVGTEQGGVILVGKGGSGKSTTTLACLNSGMSYAGDDYCVVDTKAAPHLHSLYNTAKLKGPEDLDRFPQLREHVWNADCLTKNNGDKATFFLTQWWPEKMSPGFPLRAVMVPRITGQPNTELGECSEAQALLALSASTLAQLPMAGPEDLERLGNLVAQLPRYTLYLGTDITQIPAAIRSVL